MPQNGQKWPKKARNFFRFFPVSAVTGWHVLAMYKWNVRLGEAVLRYEREWRHHFLVFEKNAKTSFFGKKCHTIIAIVLLSISRRFDEVNEQSLHRWNPTVHAVWVLGRFSRSYVESIYYESKGAERKLINRLLWISEIRQTFADES